MNGKTWSLLLLWAVILSLVASGCASPYAVMGMYQAAQGLQIAQGAAALGLTAKEALKQETPEAPTAYPPYEGMRKRVAVMVFENKAGFGPYNQLGIGEGLAEMLTTELSRTGRFVLVERAAVQDVMREQEFGTSGRVATPSAPAAGQILGAQVLVRSAVTEFHENVVGGGGSLGIYGGPTTAIKVNSARVAVDIRLIDATTSEILASDSATGYAKEVGAGIKAHAYPFSANAEAFYNSPMGKAVRQSIGRAVQTIMNRLEQLPWVGRIVEVLGDGKEIYINAGVNTGARVGDQLAVFRKTKELIDPTTGVLIGVAKRQVGTIQLTDVQDKFAIAVPIEGTDFGRDDILVLMARGARALSGETQGVSDAPKKGPRPAAAE